MNPQTKLTHNTTRRRYRVPFLLPVREKRSFLTILQTWLWQCWHQWRTKQLVVQPPLQPGRQKPFPNRPHHQRRQAVFAALDAAPAGLTRRQLMAHVRAVTGVGCSEKLITEWRKERLGEAGTRGHRDTVNGHDEATQRVKEMKKRKRAIQLRLFLACLMWGAAMKLWHPALPANAQEITISPAPSETPPLSNLPPQSSNPPVPRLLRIKLTLEAPSALRIKPGDEVRAGDLLSDRTHARQRLLVQKRALQTAAQHLRTQQQLTAVSLRQLQSLGLELPPITFAAEQAAIKRAEAEAVTVQREVEIQQQKVLEIRERVSTSSLAIIPGHLTPDTWHLIEAHEQAKLTQAQDKQLLARSEIELHKARLTTAREGRAYAEKQHRIELMRQLLSARSQQQQGETELARLTAQLAELDLQLAQLAEVRAPFAGHIKRIEWGEMNDEKLTVVVYLAVTQ